jgi:hypothetical protein
MLQKVRRLGRSLVVMSLASMSLVLASGVSVDASAVHLDPEFELKIPASSTNTLQIRDTAVDKDGNLYLVGQLWGTLDLDPSAATVSVTGDSKAIIVKYSPTGGYLWHMVVGGTNSQWSSISFEPNGENWWVIGSIYGIMNPTVTEFNFNPRGTEYKLTGFSTSNPHAVVARYNQAGQLVSAGGSAVAFRLGNSGQATGAGIKATTTGVVINGNFWSSTASPMNFNPRGTTYGVTGARTGGGVDAFIAKYDSSGIVDWVSSLGSTTATGYEFGRQVGVDANGDVYATGHFTSSTNYNLGGGAISFATQRHYLVKFSSAGIFQWGFKFGGTDTGGYDFVRDMEVSSSGNIFISGTQSGTHDFRGTGGTSQNIVAQTGAYSGYLVSFDSSGAYRWSTVLGWKAHPTGTTQHLSEFAGLSLASDGSLYAAGNYRGTMDFDPTASESLLTPSTSSCSLDRFVSRYSSSGSLMWVERASNVCIGNLNSAGGFDTPRVAAVGTDVFANFRSVQSSENFLIKYGPDITAPNAPSIIDLVVASDTGSNTSDNVTTDPTPTISVTASEAGGTVTVSATKSGQNTETCTMAGSASGTSCTLGALAEGTWSVSATHEDGAGLISASSSALSIVIDLTAPTASWTEPASPSTSLSLIYTLSFSEQVVGIAAGDFSYTGTASGCTFTPASSTANVTTTVNVSCASNGSVVARLTANQIQDVAGNQGPSSLVVATAVTVASDMTAPSATWSAPSTPSSSRSLSYALTFSEAVSGITAGDFSFTGTATGCVVNPSASTASNVITVAVTCGSDGSITLSLDSNSVLDTSSNTGPASATSASLVTIDTGASAPTSVPTSTPASAPTSVPTSVSPSNTSPPITSGTPAPSGTTAPVAGPILPTSGPSVSLPTTTVKPNSSATTTTAPVAASAALGVTETTTTTEPVTTSTVAALEDIELPEVQEGEAAALYRGRKVSAAITRENNELVVKVGPIAARIWALTASGGKVPLDEEGRLRLNSSDSVTVDIEGFDARSTIEVRLYSDPLLLGRTVIDESGQLSASYEIPENVEDGDHRVVLVGVADGDPLTFALSVVVGDDGNSTGIAVWIAVPLALAILAALILPVAIRRRRRRES